MKEHQVLVNNGRRRMKVEIDEKLPARKIIRKIDQEHFCQAIDFLLERTTLQQSQLHLQQLLKQRTMQTMTITLFVTNRNIELGIVRIESLKKQLLRATFRRRVGNRKRIVWRQLLFGKRVTSESNAAEDEIVEISSINWSPDRFGRVPLLANCELTLTESNQSYSQEALLDTGCTAYTVVDEAIVETIYDQLNIEPIPLINSLKMPNQLLPIKLRNKFPQKKLRLQQHQFLKNHSNILFFREENRSVLSQQQEQNQAMSQQIYQWAK